MIVSASAPVYRMRFDSSYFYILRDAFNLRIEGVLLLIRRILCYFAECEYFLRCKFLIAAHMYFVYIVSSTEWIA
jgi:hypothetical protein